MSFRSQSLIRRCGLPLLAVLTFAVLSSTARAQEEIPAPKVEIFAGYSWAHPGGSVNGVKLRDQDEGWGSSLTLDANRWAGLTLDFGGHYTRGNASPFNLNSSSHTFMLGPKLTF